MPLELKAPREGKSPNYTIRGTYLGVSVDRTSGTPDKATARRVVKAIERDIERGRFGEKAGPTFARAALNYLDANGEDRFIARLNDHFGDMPLSGIGQAEIDEAAAALYPNASAATRNRQVYTPMSAVLKRADVQILIKRPVGSGGKRRLQWLWPEEFAKLVTEARRVDDELAVFLVFLTYTGLRLSEGLDIEARDMRLAESFVYLPTSKTEEPRAIFLPPVVVDALRSHPRGLDRVGRVFRFTKGQRLYQALAKAAIPAGVPWLRFHGLCHTYATWMRRYAGLDIRGLVGTGRWADEKSAARYAHVISSEEAKKAALLPVPKELSVENPWKQAAAQAK